MKKWFAYGAMFLAVYLIFVIATAPASVLLNMVSLPKGLSLHGVSGSIWHTKIKQVSQGELQIHDVDAQLNLLSLLTLDPKISLSFGGALVPGPEGQLDVSGLLAEARIENADITLAANDVAAQLSLPIDLDAHGFVHLKLSEFVVGKPLCQLAKGDINWANASVTAMEEKVKLGSFSAKVTCEQGALALTLAPKNDLGLTFSAYIRQSGRLSGNGYLTPGEKFPEELKTVLPFIGKADNQGRYRLNL